MDVLAAHINSIWSTNTRWQKSAHIKVGYENRSGKVKTILGNRYNLLCSGAIFLDFVCCFFVITTIRNFYEIFIKYLKIEKEKIIHSTTTKQKLVNILLYSLFYFSMHRLDVSFWIFIVVITPYIQFCIILKAS